MKTTKLSVFKKRGKDKAFDVFKTKDKGLSPFFWTVFGAFFSKTIYTIDR